ncbi:MAG: hypothetical protein K6C69_06165, partial [Lachnospiraceae bacterium]|nr:hypothetical protein [Lachnospiraceae bacterium]
MITTVAPGVTVSAAEQEKSMNPVLSDSVVEDALKNMADENNTLYVDMAGDSNDLLKGITSSIQDSIVNEGLTIANTGLIKNEEEGDVSYIVSASKDSYRPTSLAQSTDNHGENLYLEGQTIKFYSNSGDAVPAYDLLGMFNPDLKEDNNLTLSLAHTGTIENPYVIMEYSPNASQSSIRPLIADAGYYSLTHEEVYGGTLNGVTYEGIKLTDEEKLVVRINLLNRLISQWNSENVANFAENQKKYDEYQTALAAYNATVNAYETLYTGLATMNLAQKEPSFKSGMTTALATALLDGYKTKIWAIIQEAYNNRTNTWDSMQSVIAGVLGTWAFSSKEEFFAYTSNDGYPGKYGLGDTYYTEYMETVDAAVEDAWAIASAKLADESVLLNPDEFKSALTVPEEPKLDSKYLNAMDVMTSLSEVDDPSDRDAVEKVLVKLEKYVVDHDILSESSYEKRLSSAYDSGLNYKIMFEKAQAYGAERDNGVAYPNYDYLYDNARAYSVDNDGNFVYSTDWEFDKYSAGTGGVTDGTGTAKVNMSAGYTMTTSVFDPILTTSQSNSGANTTEFYRCSTNQNNGKLLVMDYTFRKSCINLAYKAGKNEAGAVDSLTPYVDEYVFNGWMIDPDGDGENLVNLDTWTGTAEEFAEITSLYTSWYVRYWGENEFKLLTLTNKSDFIPVEFSGEGFQYTVYVPATIASRNSGSYHDARNQLTMCVPVHAKWITTSYNNNGVVVPGFNQTTSYMNYTDEISAWDFDFSREKYSTPESLQNVIPSLMGDTDYHTLFYNAIPSYTESDGRVVVEYQPFNIKVITVDAADLNRLVYYDYMNADGSAKASMYDGDGEPIYQDTDAIRRFINNIDFMYFDGGRGSVYFGNHSSVDDTAAIKCFEKRDASGKLVSDETTVYNNGTRYRKVVEDKCPSLCDSEKNANDQYVLSFNESKIKTGLKYGSDLNSCTDIEWQVAYRMYLRTAGGNADSDPNQQYRRMAVIIDEAT